MKICCDLCGGTLQMNTAGQDATCLTCGMSYTMERLRRMLQSAQTPAVPVPKPAAPAPAPAPKPAVPATSVPAPKPAVPAPAVPAPFGMNGQIFAKTSTVPQFVMDVTSGKGDVFNGIVRQGAVGVGDRVYINYDYSHPYTVLGDGGGNIIVKQGAVRLKLDDCPKKVAQEASIITGVPNPVESYYNSQNAASPLAYFENLLRREFSDYQLEKEVPCAGVKKPVTFLLSRNGQPRVAVFVVDRQSQFERHAVQKAAQVLAPYGVGVTHFYKFFRNDAPYVVERIRAAMK